MNIEQIADRANQLSGSMSHGQACWAACLEFDVEEAELSTTASIVSTVLTNREINPRQLSAEEKQKMDTQRAAVAALVPKYLALMAEAMEAEARERGGNWKRKAIAAIRRGSPRSQHRHMAELRAREELGLI